MTSEESLEVLFKALLFYADPDNWTTRTSGHGCSSQDVIKKDGAWNGCSGNTAREALKKVFPEYFEKVKL